jgi:hypothetical protein
VSADVGQFYSDAVGLYYSVVDKQCDGPDLGQGGVDPAKEAAGNHPCSYGARLQKCKESSKLSQKPGGSTRRGCRT